MHRLTLIFLIFLTLSGCGEDYTFQPQWEEAAQKANDVLIANHLCTLGHACPGGSVLFVGPHAGGMNVEIYGVQDTDVVWQMINIFTDEFQKSPAMKYLRVEVYPASHQIEVQSSSLFFGPTNSIVDVEVRRK